ncbi:RHS repeat-associated core domain-containing protein [Luteolibacter sp. Populi]|uniref:RHS repeat-associated core domain-containing protein n=1 Tax=Luteolibacter sp. Populi TaxID=3230487 RepID=UPI0034669A54
MTTWEFEDPMAAALEGLPAGSTTMTLWADPTAKIDALGRRETYTYSGSYRIMNGTDDPYHTTTGFTVDGLGRRTTKSVLQDGVTPLQQERYAYGNSSFKAFQTSTATLAFDSVSGQAWEVNLETSYLPDANGRLQRQTVDPGGENLVTEHTYDFNNNRTSTRDPRGNRTRFKYDELNRLIEVTYPSAGTRTGERVTTKQIWYNENGNKAAEIDEEGLYTIFHYDIFNRLTAKIRDMDGAGLPTRNAEGLVTEGTKGSVTGGDLATSFTYDAVGSLILQTDPKGAVTRTFYDAIQRPTHVFTGLTAVEAAGDLLACSNAANVSADKTYTEYKYTDADLDLPEGGVVKGNPGSTAFDSSGFKPTEVIRHGAVLTASGTINLHTYTQYDVLYRPLRTEIEYESGVFSISETVYGDGNLNDGKEALEITTTDERNKVTKTMLDGLLRATSITDASGSALAATSETVYSSTGLVWKTIDAENRETETEYDGVGRTVTVWRPDPLTGLVNRATPDNPLLGSPASRTGYDKNGNVTSTVNPLGHRWEYEFDARNRRITERQPAVTDTTVSGGQPVSLPFRNPVVRTAYDGAGNAIAISDARGYVTRSILNKAYRVTHVLTNPITGNPSADPDNLGANDILVRTKSDPNGNAEEIIDGNGNATRNTYDRLNRLLTTAVNPINGQPSATPSTPNADDITVANAYDDSGNLVRVIDGEGRITGFRYDGLARKTRTLWDEGIIGIEKVEQSTFNGVLKLTRTDSKNQVTTYQYDALNRLENVLYTGAAADNRHNDYDLAGNLLGVTYPNETVPRQALRASGQIFDKLNRLISETSSGATHTHSYDKAGNRRTTTYAASGRFLSSTYDKLNRLLTCTEKASSSAPVGNVTTYAYDLNGNVTRKVLPNGSAANCSFDALNRKLVEETRTATGGLISVFNYSLPVAGYPSGYDKNGNVLKISELYGHASVRDRIVTNAYDRAYRLDTETIQENGGSTVTTDYAYDDANNRTHKTVTGGTNPGTWVSAYGTTADGYNSNQLKSVTKSGTVTAFLYDANGSRITKKVSGVTVQTYGYDFENRLVSVVDSVKGSFAYTYDSRTRRVGRDESSAGGASEKLSFAGGLSVQEYTGSSGSPTVEYIRGSDYGGGIGGVLYTIRGGITRSYNAYNSRGDVVSKTDQGGSITWQSSYEAFGTRTQEQGVTLDRQKANTKDEDPTGLLNEGIRYRDLEFGIFLTRDPAGFVSGPNVYTYVRQNPWTSYDPLGLWDLRGYLRGEQGLIPGMHTKVRVQNGLVAGGAGAASGAVVGAGTGAVVGAVAGAGVGAAPGAVAGATAGAIGGGVGGFLSGFTADINSSTGDLVTNGAITGVVAGVTGGVAGGLTGPAAGGISGAMKEAGEEIVSEATGIPLDLADVSKLVKKADGLADSAREATEEVQEQVARRARGTEYPHSFRKSSKDKVIAENTDAQGNIIDRETGFVIPRNQLSLEHQRPVVQHWNEEGFNMTKKQRRDWFNDTSNLTVKPKSKNSSEGAKMKDRYRQETGEGYSN